MRPAGRSVAELLRFSAAAGRAAVAEQAGPGAVRALRARRLRALLRAVRQTPLYQQRLRAAGGALGAVEPLTKAELLARLEESFPDRRLRRALLQDQIRHPERAGEWLWGEYLVAVTSGTTGLMGIFVHDRASWARTRGVLFSRIFRSVLHAAGAWRFLLHRPYPMAFVAAAEGHYMTALLASQVPAVAEPWLDARVFSVEWPVPELVRRLNAFSPRVLHSYPTVLELLCVERQAGRLQATPELITAGSEPLTASCRTAVAQAFPDALLVETYAATECVPMATSCPLGALHVNEDACLLEPIAADGRPVAPGELSDRVWMTNLLNTAQPLVRYELGDRVRLVPEPCPCGLPLQVIEVHGRSDDTFYLFDGRGRVQAHAPIPLELIFLGIVGLVQFQLVHEKQNAWRVRYVAEAGAGGERVEQALAMRIRRYLAEHRLEAHVHVVLERTDAIPRHRASKKMRQIRSVVPKPPGLTVPAHSVRQGRGHERTEEVVP